MSRESLRKGVIYGIAAYGMWGLIPIYFKAVSAVPLLFFTSAAHLLPLSVLGFLQYIAPSRQFLLAVFAYGEPLTSAHLVTFGCIWVALAIFTVDQVRNAKS